MSENSETYRISRLLKRWWVWIPLLLLLFVVLIRISLNTRVVHNWVKSRVVNSVNSEINGTVTIGRLEGDLWKEIRLVDIALQVPGDTLARVDTLYARYNILSLLASVFEVGQLSLSNPELTVEQNRDGRWKGSSLMKEDTSNVDRTAFPIRIGRMTVSGGKIKGRIEQWPDSLIHIRDITIESSLAYLEGGYEVELRKLMFRMMQTRLNEPVTFQSAGTVTGRVITLDQLVMATGASMVHTSGRIDRSDSTVRLDLNALPVSWKDLSSYFGEYPVREDMQIRMNVSGNARKADLNVDIKSDEIERLNLNLSISYDSAAVLRSLEINSGRLNLAALTGREEFPTVDNGRIELNGNLPLKAYREADISGSYKFQNIRLSDYRWENISGSFSLVEGRVETEANLLRGREEIALRAEGNNIWGDLPRFTVNATANRLDPGYWTGDRSWSGSLSGSIEVEGTGLTATDLNWNYLLNVTGGTVAGQSFAGFRSEGRVKGKSLTTRSSLHLDKSRINFDVELKDIYTRPAYNYVINTESLNLSEINGIERFPTSIKARVEGEGEYLSPEKLRLWSSVRVDSSTVNNEWVEEMTADIRVSDTLLHVSDASLSSDIAEGTFSSRMHLLRWFEPDNQLEFKLVLKDIGALAPLTGATRLQMDGQIEGHLQPVEEEQLNFSGSVDFNDVAYNDDFFAERVEGNVEMLVVKEPEYDLNLNITKPSIKSVALQDVIVNTKGRLAESLTSGNIEVTFNHSGNNRIQHVGSYRLSQDSVYLNTVDLRIENTGRTLQLSRPFDLLYAGSSIQMDTLHLESDDSAYLEMAIQNADSSTQQGYFKVQALNLTEIQNTLLNTSYVDGELSGQMQIDRQGTLFNSSGQIAISGLGYKGTALDLLNLNYEISENRIKGGLKVNDEGDQLVSGSLSAPFKLGNPETFGESFFREPVSGEYEIRPVRLNRFEELLADWGVENTDGILHSRGTIGGTAGKPELTASLQLNEATVSGIAIDSLSSSVDYVHENANLNVRGAVYSLKQQAAEINASLPVYIDLKSFSTNLPGAEDPIDINIETNDFNLSALGDFVDRNQLQKLRGRLNGQVSVGGTFGKPSANGRLTLSGGGVGVVNAGINIGEVESSLSFRGDTVQVTRFRAKSGNGSFRVSGLFNLKGLLPDQLNLDLKAENFRIAQTPDYRGSINMDGRVRGSLSSLLVTGNLSIISGYVYLKNFGDRSVENIQLDTVETAGGRNALYDSLRLDMDLSFDRRFFVRNRRFIDMEIELEGQLDLLKESGEPLQLFGTLTGVRGYARPLGKQFTLEKSSVTFSGNPVNPGMMVRTLYEPPQPEADIKIWYVIEGTVESPKFKYESSPPMELQNIISYTLFGQPFYALNSWKQVVANSSGSSSTTTTDVAMDILLDRVESLATQKLGVDVVQIDNTSSGSERGTSIKTGWYLSPRVFFAIQNQITGSNPDTMFILEYLIKKNLKLIINQGGDNRDGVDLEWEHNY